jgi:hypothetical protein
MPPDLSGISNAGFWGFSIGGKKINLFGCALEHV